MKRKKSRKVGIQILILFLLLVIYPAAARADSPLNITMTPQAMGDGRWDVTIEAENLRGIAMMQFALEYEAGGLQCLGYDKGSVFDGNLDPLVNTGSEGMIYFSWDSLNSLSADGTVMTLHFMSTEGAETALHFDSSRPTVFAYSNYSSPDVSLSGCIIGAPSAQPGDTGDEQASSNTPDPTPPAQTQPTASGTQTATAPGDETAATGQQSTNQAAGSMGGSGSGASADPGDTGERESNQPSGSTGSGEPAAPSPTVTPTGTPASQNTAPIPDTSSEQGTPETEGKRTELPTVYVEHHEPVYHSRPSVQAILLRAGILLLLLAGAAAGAVMLMKRKGKNTGKQAVKHGGRGKHEKI